MWSSFFWRSRDRFSVDELRYLTEQLQKLQDVNDANKDFVVEALRSIAELLTYGDQHNSSFFDFFMEKQVMGEFVRILGISRTASVPLQLLQTLSIMIQNIKNEHAIYYIFSNEHINCLITYSFNFDNEELLSFYVSFLRAISGKLNQNTISLLIKTENDKVVSFPLYVEGIKFAFHEENMIRTAIRALTLNIYHVGDDGVNQFVASSPHAKYFSNMVKFFCRQCIDLNKLLSNASGDEPDLTSKILSTVDEIEDTLYYFSDIISAGIPDVGRLMTDKILKHLVFQLLLPSLRTESTQEGLIGSITSLYLLCCILHIVKIKDLANVIAAVFSQPEASIPSWGIQVNGIVTGHNCSHQRQSSGDEGASWENNVPLRISESSSSSDMQNNAVNINIRKSSAVSHIALRERLLSYVRLGNDVQVLGSLSVLATLLQTKELDESMLDALGILPQRKKQKKLLLEALVGEASGEDQLFSPEASSRRDSISSELDDYIEKLKERYGLSSLILEEGASPKIHRFQVLDSLVTLFSRPNISAETLWYGGWLIRQLLPYGEAEFSGHHLLTLKESYNKSAHALVEETRSSWPDQIVMVLCDEWRKCKRAIEAPSPRKEPKYILLSLLRPSEDGIPAESSFAAGKRMYETVKVFVLLHQLQVFSMGRSLPEQPSIDSHTDVRENSRGKNAGLDECGPKPGTEIKIVDAVPCRISFERGRERHFYFLAASLGTYGWILLAEELPLKQYHGVVRIAAPLAGSNPKIDEKHPKWLHIRIRPSTLPSADPSKSSLQGKIKARALVDGRWTLAFRDDESCKLALSMIIEEINMQRNEVERRLKPLLSVDAISGYSNLSPHPLSHMSISRLSS
ncbi:hypothetical protein SAY87_007409 [Trapa incisa]|uniref:FPL domain-containing protein n=1 Tax=Trapa incisa TaxID=236973 RepID=A0AAN7K2X6_9MYRT|nr:hypothetical protein SAY87_007409 [Trapa incisa]